MLKFSTLISNYTFLPPRLTVFENLLVFAGLYNIPNPRTKIERLLDSFGILHLGDLSSGELTRLNLCKSLINDPEILFLDEPTASLDPDIAQKAREFLVQIKREKGISLLLTSHNMDEVTQMCNRVIFINHGKIVAADTPLDLSKTIKKSILTIVFEAPLTKVKTFCKKNKLHCEIPQFNVLSIEVKEESIS